MLGFRFQGLGCRAGELGFRDVWGLYGARTGVRDLKFLKAACWGEGGGGGGLGFRFFFFWGGGGDPTPESAGQDGNFL